MDPVIIHYQGVDVEGSFGVHEAHDFSQGPYTAVNHPLNLKTGSLTSETIGTLEYITDGLSENLYFTADQEKVRAAIKAASPTRRLDITQPIELVPDIDTLVLFYDTKLKNHAATLSVEIPGEEVSPDANIIQEPFLATSPDDDDYDFTPMGPKGGF